MSNPRVLIIAHGHPDFSLGGGEIAAHSHWTELRRRGIEATLVAYVNQSPGHTGTTFFARSPDSNEILFHAPPINHFRHSQTHGSQFYEHLRELLQSIMPTVVHFHHYSYVGLEFIREVRKYSEDIPIILTLHEFLGICNANGQMVKTNGLLCRKASPLDCHLCFPQISAQDFFMRELFIKSFFSLVDCFICPSEFLRDRYIEWGLPPGKMTVLENGQPLANKPEALEAAPAGSHTRFIVLGQLSRRKGTLLLLEAVALLPKDFRQTVRIEIYGTTQYAEEEFKACFEKALTETKDTVTFCGPYRSQDVRGILRSSGWLIVPSLWWENSPLVIQEAFDAGRPVICSNIGGMAEKVRDGVNGRHFRVNSAADLAACIQECAGDPGLWNNLRAGVSEPPSIVQTVGQLLTLYNNGRAVAKGGRAAGVSERVDTA